MILHIFNLYSFLFIIHCSCYNNYCKRWKPKCVRNISITKKVSDLQIQHSQKCRLETHYYEGQTKSNAGYVILAINKSRQFLPAFSFNIPEQNEKTCFQYSYDKNGCDMPWFSQECYTSLTPRWELQCRLLHVTGISGVSAETFKSD